MSSDSRITRRSRPWPSYHAAYIGIWVHKLRTQLSHCPRASTKKFKTRRYPRSPYVRRWPSFHSQSATPNKPSLYIVQLGGRCIQMQCISSNPNPYKSLKYAAFGPLYAGGGVQFFLPPDCINVLTHTSIRPIHQWAQPTHQSGGYNNILI